MGVPTIDESQLVLSTLRAEAQAITAAASTVAETLPQAAARILRAPGRVVVAGVGTSHATALRLAHLLTCCGTPAHFMHPGDAVHGGAGAVTSQDVLVTVSKGGESDDVNALAAIARERGATLIALTGAPTSTLGRMADHVVVIPTPDDVDPYGMIATGSSLVTAAVGDALCVLLLNARGYSREAFGRTHPGGAVGRRIAGEPDASEAKIGLGDKPRKGRRHARPER